MLIAVNVAEIGKQRLQLELVQRSWHSTERGEYVLAHQDRHRETVERAPIQSIRTRHAERHKLTV
jgi:hypothetical protein